MNSLVKSLRIGFLITSFFFLSLGISATPRLATDNELTGWVVVLAAGFLLPAISGALAYSGALSIGHGHTGASNPASFAVASLFPTLALWLLCVLLASTDSSHLIKEALIPGGIDVIFLSILFVFIRAHAGSPTGPRPSSRSSQNWVVHLCNWVDRWLQRGERIFRPSLLLAAGVALVLCAPLISSGKPLDLEVWLRDRWIAAEWGLADHLPVLRPAFDLLGRTSFVVAVLLAASTLVFALARTIRPGSRVLHRVCNIFACAAAILAMCSTMDLYFGWVGFFGGRNASDLWLWSFFALGAFVLACGLAMVVTTITFNGRHRAILIPCAVRLYATVACSNVLFSAAFLSAGDRGFNGLGAFYLGVQFLAWGWIELTVQHEVNHEEDKLENCPTHSSDVVREATVTL